MVLDIKSTTFAGLVKSSHHGESRPLAKPCGERRGCRQLLFSCTMDFWAVLSKTAEYALRAAAHLAGCQSGPASASALAEKTRAPRRYLHRVLQDLVLAGLVESRPGPGGGYTLARANSEITLLDIVNAVDPIGRIHHCPLGLRSHTSLCPLHSELDRAYEAIEVAFRSVSLQDLTDSTSKIRPLCEDAIQP